MSTDAAPIFDAALALPEALRADLAAKLIESLDNDAPPAPNRTPQEWERIIKERSDELHRGDAELIDGDVAVAMLRAIVDRVAPAT
jgi:hypothetical protein